MVPDSRWIDSHFHNKIVITALLMVNNISLNSINSKVLFTVLCNGLDVKLLHPHPVHRCWELASPNCKAYSWYLGGWLAHEDSVINSRLRCWWTHDWMHYCGGGGGNYGWWLSLEWKWFAGSVVLRDTPGAWASFFLSHLGLSAQLWWGALSPPTPMETLAFMLLSITSDSKQWIQKTLEVWPGINSSSFRLFLSTICHSDELTYH